MHAERRFYQNPVPFFQKLGQRIDHLLAGRKPFAPLPCSGGEVRGEAYVVSDPKTVTVKADNKSKPYGDQDPVLSATVTGLVNATDTIAYTLTRVAGEDVGTYTITPTGEELQGNYQVVFETGEFTIYKREGVVVTITGHNDTKDYDGAEHTVTGYDVTSITIGGEATTLYTEADFEFTGTATASRTEVGTTNMGLAADQFTNKNDNFKDVTFNVIDGYQTIDPINVTVTIVGANNTTDYDGEEHSVSGYTATADNDLYDVTKWRQTSSQTPIRTSEP